MAKKKSVKMEAVKEMKEIAKSVKDLEGKLSAAKELLESKDKDIAALNQKIKDDTGIPPSTNAELIQYKNTAKKMSEQNAALKEQNRSFAKELSDLKAKLPVLSEAPAKTSIPFDKIVSCLGSVNVMIDSRKFAKSVPTLLNNAIVLAEAIRTRTTREE